MAVRLSHQKVNDGFFHERDAVFRASTHNLTVVPRTEIVNQHTTPARDPRSQIIFQPHLYQSKSLTKQPHLKLNPAPANVKSPECGAKRPPPAKTQLKKETK